MPEAGSQPSVTANRMMNNSASQNGGTEMPAKQNRLTALSVAECWRTAAAMPSGSATSTASTELTPSSTSVLPSRGPMISSTGRL